MSNDLQEQAFHKWKENTYQEFLDSEIHNWQENGGSYDEADLHPMGTCQTLFQLVQGTEQVLPTAMIRYMVVVLAR